MRSTTITGEVKNLKRVKIAGESSAIFEIGDQSVRFYSRHLILENGDQVIVAGKYQGRVFVSNALHNLTQSETVGKVGMSQFIPYLAGAFFIGAAALICADYIQHGHGPVVAAIAGAFFTVGLACLYFPSSRSRQKRLVKTAARDIS